jgi:3-deoxy-D-manno-octulosonic-acid transferase
MLWFLYNVLFAVGYVLMMPRFIVRMLRRGGYARNFLQRVGIYSPETRQRLATAGRVWVHAVSVGEIYVALKFIEELRACDPKRTFVLTTTTSTGYRIAGSKINAADVLLYFPSDFPFIVNRVLDLIKPAALVLVESELWPNLIRYSTGRGIPVVLVNGRVSESSFRGYKLIKVFIGKVLRMMDAFFVQTAVDRDHLVELGADPAKVKVLGTVKYDVAQFDSAGEEKARDVMHRAGISRGDLVLTGGSTWQGEEAILLGAYERLRKRFANLKLVLVPRHAERSGEVESEIRNRGLKYVRRTELEEGPAEADVLLVDTTGELKSFYACSSVIFVGKSLTQHGGQNVIEPGLYGKPVVIGPNMENFLSVVSDFLSAGAMVQVRDAAGLESAVEILLSDGAKREDLGKRAVAVVRDKRGVVRKSAEMIRPLIR